MKALIILNPPEDDRERELLLETVDRHFAPVPIAYEIYETREGGRLADIVRDRLSDGFNLVVASGGDGTVSAVGDGLTGSEVPLGIIPTGTGNLIARELEIPLDLEESVALIAGAHRKRKVDGMRIGKRIFFLNASVGISAAVVGGTTRGSKNRFGRIAYLGTTMVKVLSSKPRYLIVETDGEAHPYHAVDVAIMNCGIIGKQLYPGDTDISIDDGHLGVGILSVKKVWHCSWYAIGVLVGWIVTPRSHFIKVDKTVSIRSNVPLQVQADGDLIGTTPIQVELLPGALTVLVPA